MAAPKKSEPVGKKASKKFGGKQAPPFGKGKKEQEKAGKK
jgi:hypothetical protein